MKRWWRLFRLGLASWIGGDAIADPKEIYYLREMLKHYRASSDHWRERYYKVQAGAQPAAPRTATAAFAQLATEAERMRAYQAHYQQIADQQRQLNAAFAGAIGLGAVIGAPLGELARREPDR